MPWPISRPGQMAEARISYPQLKRLALNTLGAALYRAGRIDEAIARLEESVKASGGVGVPQDWAFLAMAHHKKGNDDEARRWLEKLRSDKPDEKAGFSTDVVECRMFHREAEALLRKTSAALPDPIRERAPPLAAADRAGLAASGRLLDTRNVPVYESHPRGEELIESDAGEDRAISGSSVPSAAGRDEISIRPKNHSQNGQRSSRHTVLTRDLELAP
jgi:tetratricopeptide (TPR) repeat protein